jgi:hypothetical protein
MRRGHLLLPMAVLFALSACHPGRMQPSESFSFVLERSQTGWSARCTTGCRWTNLTFNYGRNVARISASGVAGPAVADTETAGFAFDLQPQTSGWTATTIRGTRWQNLSWQCAQGTPVCRARVTESGVSGE